MLFFIIGFANILGWIIAREQIPETIANFLLVPEHQSHGPDASGIGLFTLFGHLDGNHRQLHHHRPNFVTGHGEGGNSSGSLCGCHARGAQCRIDHPATLGVALFASVGVGKVSFEEVCSELWPFLIVDVFVILLLVFIPELSLSSSPGRSGSFPSENTVLRGFEERQKASPGNVTEATRFFLKMTVIR